ncbi:hypothetical protein ACWD4O_35655 [Streptomyces sp. NPDC002623]
MSASTVRRRLAQDALKPWQHRSWIFITSPDFRLKAAWVLDLYARTWQGEQHGDDEYVISADEKTAGQARPVHRRSPRRILCRTGSVNNPRRIYGTDHLEVVARGKFRELLVAGQAAAMAGPRLCQSLRTMYGILRPRAAHGRLMPHDR